MGDDLEDNWTADFDAPIKGKKQQKRPLEQLEGINKKNSSNMKGNNANHAAQPNKKAKTHPNGNPNPNPNPNSNSNGKTKEQNLKEKEETGGDDLEDNLGIMVEGKDLEKDEEIEGQAKNKQNNKKRKRKSEKLKGIRSPFAVLGPIHQATPKMVLEYLLKMVKVAFPLKSDLELEPLQFKENHIDPPYSKEHTEDNLEDFLKTEFPNFQKEFSSKAKSSKNGAPVVIIVSPSAVRCVDMIRSLKSVGAHCKIGKLFAKHLKIEEQKELLNNNIIKIAVGTPARMEQLFDQGDLSIVDLKLIIIDMFVDQKGKTIFEIADTRAALFSFLQNSCSKVIFDEQTKISLY